MMKLSGLIRSLLLIALAAGLTGCNVGGFLANAADLSATVDASYKGLHDQTCGVMVWADDGVLNDFRTLQLDTAKGIQVKLDEAAKVQTAEVMNIKWVPAERILEYQQNNTDISSEAAEVVATRLGLTRLIYIEVEQFQTHPPNSPDLWRGSMIATIQVIEVKDGSAKVVYSERGVSIVSPKNCPEEGLPNLDDDSVYAATLDTFTGEVGKRFVPHEADAGVNPAPGEAEQ
jgi:hypothetical protein